MEAPTYYQHCQHQHATHAKILFFKLLSAHTPLEQTQDYTADHCGDHPYDDFSDVTFFASTRIGASRFFGGHKKRIAAAAKGSNIRRESQEFVR